MAGRNPAPNRRVGGSRRLRASDIAPSHSLNNGLGDARVTARFQGFGGPGITGVPLGIKLPTDGFGTRFASGPQAGEALHRGLQAGSGTTDLIAGAYHFRALTGDFDRFAEACAAIPLNTRADYRPGTSGIGGIGLHYSGWRAITPQFQLNLRLAGKDSGASADREDSGGALLYLSPGATVKLIPRLSVFGFVQLPLDQSVNGYQLVPEFTVSAGLQVRL